MTDFQIGDLVEFIPENFSSFYWTYCLVGVGYIEKIDKIKTINIAEQHVDIYSVYCGKVIKQLNKNFVEMEVRDITFQFTNSQMKQICKKLTQ